MTSGCGTADDRPNGPWRTTGDRPDSQSYQLLLVSWGSQAVDLAPSQGAIVEFDMPEDGLYQMVTHAFNFVGCRALGPFQAGDGDPLN